MTTLDRSDWKSSPFTKELIEHLEGGRREIEEALGLGAFTADDAAKTAMGYVNAVGRLSMLGLVLDYVEHGPLEDRPDEDDSEGNVAEEYADGT